MNEQPENIREILKNAQKYTVSPKKDAQIIKELNNLQHNKPIPLTNIIMGNYKKIAAFTVALAVVAVVGLSGVLNSQTTYASHLENAEKALQELQVMQNDGADVNEERMRELVQEILQETNAALALAEGEEGEQLQQALQEVKSVQEKSLSMFKNFEGDAVGDAVKEAEQKHERVKKMLGEQVKEQTQEQKHLENAEKAMEQLQLMQGEDQDPARVRELAQEVVQEANAALTLAEQKQEGEQKQQALQEVQAVQEKAMNMFKNFEGEGVGEAMQDAEQLQERVRAKLGQ